MVVYIRALLLGRRCLQSNIICIERFYAWAQKMHATQGITEREDCLMRVIDAYKTHLTSRRSKPIIEVEVAGLSMAKANALVTHAEKAQLPKKFKANKIDHKEYLTILN